MKWCLVPGHSHAAAACLQVELERIQLYLSMQLSETILEVDRIIMPVHLGNHWTCAVINLAAKELVYYDSMGVSCHCVSGSQFLMTRSPSCVFARLVAPQRRDSGRLHNMCCSALGVVSKGRSGKASLSSLSVPSHT